MNAARAVIGAMQRPRSGGGPAGSEFRAATGRSAAELSGAALLVNIGNGLLVLHSGEPPGQVPGGAGGNAWPQSLHKRAALWRFP